MAKKRWLDQREQRVWRAFLEANAAVTARLQLQLQRDCGLSDADYEVLVHLSEAREHRLRAFELSRATRWEKSRLSHHLRRMEQRGLVLREGCPTDRRGAFVGLTEVGAAAIKAAAPLHALEVRRCFLDALDADQLDALGDIAATLIAHLGAEATEHRR